MTILIKNVQLLDGTGRQAVKADVLVKKNKIYAIGSFPRYRADEIIDGLGAYCSPGFIDINTDSDHYLALFSNPSQTDFILQGVTSIIGGQCGISLAPLLYGSLESIKQWADISRININWQTVKEFLKSIENRSLGVNFGTLIGHQTIRQDLTGDAMRDLTRNELLVFKSILERSFKDGALGFSTGLGYTSGKNISYSEIKSLAEVAAKYKVLYATHLRNEKRGLLSAVNETIGIAKETGVKVLISHLRPLIGYSKDYEEALNLISQNTDKADVYFDLYPFDKSTVLIQTLLPEWAQEGGYETMLRDIETPGLREKILRELPRLSGEETIIINAPQNEYLIGKSLKKFAQNRDLTVSEAILELIKITNGRAVISYKNISLKKAIQALIHERAIVASNSASFNNDSPFFVKKYIKPERSYKTFKKFLELVEKEKILPIEKAIYKITGLPAKILGLKNRGIIRDDYAADLVIFKDAEIREVLLNGKRIIKDGKSQHILAGEILRR